MSDEVGLEREDERHAQQAAAEQVGVGTAPGQPPASGTGPRSQPTAEPATGRRDDERATWGASEAVPGSVPEGAPPHNVGGAPGDRPADAVADQPGADEAHKAGSYEPEQRRSAGRSNLPPG